MGLFSHTVSAPSVAISGIVAELQATTKRLYIREILVSPDAATSIGLNLFRVGGSSPGTIGDTGSGSRGRTEDPEDTGSTAWLMTAWTTVPAPGAGQVALRRVRVPATQALLYRFMWPLGRELIVPAGSSLIWQSVAVSPPASVGFLWKE